MAVNYVRWGDSGVRVSRRWRVVLLAARESGVRFKVNSGHRTMLEQALMFRQNMRLVGGRWVAKPGRPLTAFPTPNAPHIFTGRAAHALDVDEFYGDGVKGLAHWLRVRKAHVAFPVKGENWHMVVTGRDLARLWRKYRPTDPVAVVRQSMSRKGREFLAREEGMIPYAYNDPAGHATFGIGHLIHRGAVTAEDREKWGTKDRPHSREMVMRVFKRDLRKYEKAVRDAVGRRLPQRQFDACCSLCFNIGVGGFAGSTVAKVLREDSPSVRAQRAADAFLLWDKPAMLRPRREREKRLFLEGRYK